MTTDAQTQTATTTYRVIVEKDRTAMWFWGVYEPGREATEYRHLDSLECGYTLTRWFARWSAKQACRQLAAGNYREVWTYEAFDA